MKNKIYYIILVIFSLLINQYFANRGVFPIDSFLIFDAGYNIISGHHPFKDYWLITGPFVDYIQSIFFIIFGISWFSYVLHASVLNMAFVLFSFFFFQKIGLKNYYAFMYAIGVAILAYPPIGSPFIDSHSVIFCMMAIYSLSLAILLKRNLFWFLIPIFLAASFFSKQIPSPYFVILFAAVILWYFIITKKVFSQNLIYLIFGSVTSFFLILSVFLINKIPIENFLIQYIFYPISLGEERISNLNFDFNNTIGQFKYIYFAIFPLAISTYFLVKIKNKNLEQFNEIIISIIFLLSTIIFIYCQLLTLNQILIFFLIPISLAYGHAYSIKYFNKKFLTYFIIAIFFVSVTKYHLRFNHNKKFMDLANADFNLAVNATQLDKRLKGLKWITPHYIDEPQKEINLLIDIKNILSKADEKRIFITDYQFLPSFLNNKYVSPNKWYDELSIPSKKNQFYKVFKDFFIKSINKNEIKYIYFVGHHKHTLNFFSQLRHENNCIISKEINEMLIEYNLNNCKEIF